MAEPKVSVLVVAKNEARHLAACLSAVGWAHERIVVVDASSSDETLAIAVREADKTAVRVFDDFAHQRNFALTLADGEWVLAIDADERSTPAFEAEVKRAIARANPAIAGFRVPIRSVVLGRRFAFSGTQHDLPLRLFRRGRGYWTGLVHETVALDGRIETLKHGLEHHTLADARTFLDKINRYTDLEAQELVESGRRFRLGALLVRPVWVFLKLYLGKQGFRDGLEGLAFCVFSGFSAFVRAWKHRERERALGAAAGHDRGTRAARSAAISLQVFEADSPGRAA